MKLFDKMERCVITYNGAFYTKLFGMYGYVCIDGDMVKFFFDTEGEINWNDVTEYYDIISE